MYFRTASQRGPEFMDWWTISPPVYNINKNKKIQILFSSGMKERSHKINLRSHRITVVEGGGRREQSKPRVVTREQQEWPRQNSVRRITKK